MPDIERIEDSILDIILELQIKIARAGEHERLFWWRIDATDLEGGGDFFIRLVGSVSGLCAVEAAITGARMFELQKLDEAGIDYEIISLFNPEFNLKMQLDERWMHFKSNPDDVPEIISILMDHQLTFNRNAFTRELESYQRPRFERTPLGRKIIGKFPKDPVQQMRQLAALLMPLEDRFYPLPYYSIIK